MSEQTYRSPVINKLEVRGYSHKHETDDGWSVAPTKADIPIALGRAARLEEYNG